LAPAIALSAAVNLVITLPILPADRAEPVIALNGDVGEMIGWPDFVQTVADVRRTIPGDVEILTRNYGEAGAIDRYGPPLGLPPAHSGHNAYSTWGPPASTAQVISIGVDLEGCREAARITNKAGIHNDEWGQRVLVCPAPNWTEIWPSLRHYG
ncbi:hypothetical protein ACFQ1S_40745, partial [Kibdelosporangium lantanae]